MAEPLLPSPPRLFLIDGYALIYRAFFAMLARPLSTSHGENTSAAWGIANFLDRLLRKHQPEYIAWVHDSGTSFRHEEYAEYKATREKLTEELQADFNRGIERIVSLLDAYGITLVTLDGFEADDVIGTLARQASAVAVNVVIVSGDKDFHQLVNDKIWLLNPGRGGPASVDENWVSSANATERLGVAPGRVTDFLALVGDTSDNVPGVPGIGEKTAQELVTSYGELEEILAHAPTIQKKRPREALLANAERARLSKRLVTIRDNIPIRLDLQSFQKREPDRARLRQLFHELEFATLVKTLEDGVEAPPAPPHERRFAVVDSPNAIPALIERIRRTGYLALRTESVNEGQPGETVSPLRSRLVGLSLAIAPEEAYYLPFSHRVHEVAQRELLGEAGNGQRTLPKIEGTSIAARHLREGAAPVVNLPPLTDQALGVLSAVLQDASIRKTVHNAKFDTLLLLRAGIMLRGVEFDTMLASYVLDPGRRSHSLDVLAMEFLGRPVTTYDQLCGTGRGQIPFDVVPVECARDYSCESVDVSLQVSRAMRTQLEAHNLDQLYREIELALVSVLVDMEWRGITIDVPWFDSLRARFERERLRVEQTVYEEAGGHFNINSNQQLRVILFERRGLPVRKRTATGASTDASVLQELADEGHRLPALLLEYRELAKLQSTYLDTLPALIHPDDKRLHTSFNQTVAATGRLSSSDPNLQNIPVRRELGRAIRHGFIPQNGWQLVTADYSQIELRLLAHLSQDTVFVEAFREGSDIHRQTAAIIFGVASEDVTPEMRSRAKTINFATIYGQGAHALSRQLKIAHSDARDFIDRYFERFEGVRRYLDSMVTLAREQGYVETIFRRRRYIPELREKNFSIRAFGERVATNAPIQGSAADLIKIAMIRLHHELNARRLESKLLLQVHDELILECPAHEVSEVQALVRHEMVHAADLSVPLVVDLGAGPNWLEAKGG